MAMTNTSIYGPGQFGEAFSAYWNVDGIYCVVGHLDMAHGQVFVAEESPRSVAALAGDQPIHIFENIRGDLEVAWWDYTTATPTYKTCVSKNTGLTWSAPV
jgi:hypothetical protein